MDGLSGGENQVDTLKLRHTHEMKVSQNPPLLLVLSHLSWPCPPLLPRRHRSRRHPQPCHKLRPSPTTSKKCRGPLCLPPLSLSTMMGSATAAENTSLMGQLLNATWEKVNLLNKSNQVTNFAKEEEENDLPPTLLANLDNYIIAFCYFIVYRNNILMILFYFTIQSIALVLFIFTNF